MAMRCMVAETSMAEEMAVVLMTFDGATILGEAVVACGGEGVM